MGDVAAAGIWLWHNPVSPRELGHMKKIVLLFAVLLLSPGTAHGDAFTIPVGAPKNTSVNDDLQVLVEPLNGGAALPVIVHVPVTSTDPRVKADAMQSAMRGAGIPGLVPLPLGGTDVKIDSNRVRGVKFVDNNSHEPESIKKTLGIQFSMVGFNGILNGTDDNGNPSIFQAAIGSAGISLDANLAFDTLSSPTVDGLLTDVFNTFLSELPLPLRPDLALDLTQDLITFQYPDGESDFFVENFSSDRTLNTVAGMVVAEPPTVLMLFFGVLALAACRYRRHAGGR
jgi:hypothetical protein